MIGTIIRVYRAAFMGLPREVWLLAFVALVNRAGTMVLPFFSLYLTRERDLSVVQAGAMLSLYGLGAIAGAWVGGRLADGLGPIRAQQASLVLAGVGFLLVPTLDRLSTITVAVPLLSIVVESFRPANMAAFAQRAPAELQARSFALLRLAGNTGMTIGPAVGGFLALYGYTWLFVADAGTCWLAAILLSVLVRATPAPGTAKASPGRVRSPWRDGPFLSLMLLTVGLAVVFFQVMSTLPLYLREICRFREDTIGLLLALNAVVIVAFEMVLIHKLERRARMALIGAGSLLVCVGFGLMPLGSSAGWIAVTIVVWTFGEMLALPLLTATVAERSGPGNRGSYMGLYTMAFSIAFVLAPAVGTHIYENLSPEILWYGLGALGVPLCLGAWALTRTFDRPTE